MWPEKPPYSIFLSSYPTNVGPPAPITAPIIVSAGPGGNLWSQKVWDMSWEPTVDFLSGSFPPGRVCWPNVTCVSSTEATSCQAVTPLWLGHLSQMSHLGHLGHLLFSVVSVHHSCVGSIVFNVGQKVSLCLCHFCYLSTKAALLKCLGDPVPQDPRV